VSLSAFAKQSEFFDDEKANWNLRRNYLYLFDNVKNEVMKLDVSIGISLMEKLEQDKLKSKLERIHPLIPNAKLGDKDKAALSMQTFNQRKDTTTVPGDSKFQVHF
jgi:hypothetical protein